MINIVLGILLISTISILVSGARGKGLIALTTVILLAVLSSIAAIKALAGSSYSVLLEGTYLFGPVPVRIDALSAWFILTINITMVTGAVYGLDYMRSYRERRSALTLHSIAYLLAHFSMLGICSLQNGFVFLIFWELLALSVFVLVIFEGYKQETLRAGINYLVQSHISIVLVMIGFIYVAYKTNNYSFDAIAEFSRQQSTLAGTALFLIFFLGFAIKSGFVPFHTWLPYAHPAAPSHVSGIMSGVVIKIGIYGIFRMLLLIKTDYSTIGYIILILSTLTGIYGVMQAIVQHDLKKLLAYHSIENIGIIGIGIGIGCIGLGEKNNWMSILGFSGALLHTLNHSLFKSLLFYSAGNVLQAVHSVNVERLGGLIRKMPQTTLLFLLAAIAICGLPPLNGFISEFLIYGGLYNWLYSASLISLVAIIFSLVGLVIIGGLAILCFTKAFSVVFLGNPRYDQETRVEEPGILRLLPMYISLAFMVSIALFPSFYVDALHRPVNLYTHEVVFNLDQIRVGAIDSLATINRMFVGLAVLVLVILGLRQLANRNRKTEEGATWGCGYTGETGRMQYTANSFVRSYSKLAKPVLDIEKRELDIAEVFPGKKHYESHSHDKLERILIDKPIKSFSRIGDLFLFLQNGQLQNYILYGIVFISAVLALPMIVSKIISLIRFLNNL